MRETRRDFLKKAILLSGSAGVSGLFTESIERAATINPSPGSSYLDAEHIVILMQENRSFDHCFGSLRGVRGFNDPRAIRQPNGNLVWMQTNERGETYIPFRFDIENTKATWMGSTPHSRSSQVDAWNYGKYDKWLSAKQVRNKKYAKIPLTLGYYTREDIPFHYALADAFTVCDQHFCSVMSSTDPNRIFFWSGTIREEQKKHTSARIRNDYPGLGTLKWSSFPERLQKAGISWKVYQNDITAGGGFKGEERSWLANFGCNPLEWFANYNVKFFPRYIETLQNQIARLPSEINDLEKRISNSSSLKEIKKWRSSISKKKNVLKNAQRDLEKWSKKNYDKLSKNEKELHQRAFTINDADPDYHDLTTLNYEINGENRSLEIPKGDVLYQFREDVRKGNLPTVSWLVAPWKLIDHPSVAWYGSLYMSEILNILTKKPEVWKKTIFILTFDENDGYFDHVPPFVAPNPDNLNTGKCSPELNTDLEYVFAKDELGEGISKKIVRDAPIGLGYRVPLLIASPWSRGGRVCSQVFDHTSTLQFLEKFLNEKYGKKIRETNISDWRRTVAGDLTNIFDIYGSKEMEMLPFLEKDPFVKRIYNAKFKELPSDFSPLSEEDIEQINRNAMHSSKMPKQEKGIRPSCALPYEIYVDGRLTKDKKNIEVIFSAKNYFFGNKSLGAPFNLYLPGRYSVGEKNFNQVGSRSYTVAAGKSLRESFLVSKFENNKYHIRIDGPNGFYRELMGNTSDPEIEIACKYEMKKGFMKQPTGNISLKFICYDNSGYDVEIKDNAYKNNLIRKALKQGVNTLILDLHKSHNWYDFSLKISGFKDFKRRYAGRVETGRLGITDPLIG